MKYEMFWVKKVGRFKYKAWTENFRTVFYSIGLKSMYRKIDKYIEKNTLF